MDDVPFQVSETPQTFPARKGRNQKRFALLIVAILIIVIFSVFITVANTRKSSTEETTTTTSTIMDEFETIIPTEEVTPEPDETDTPTPKPTVNPVDKETGLDRSDLSVEIQNGSGVAGVAGKASTFLKDLGYSVTSTGNADNFDYEGVTVRVKSGSSEYLDLLKSDLGAEYTVSDASDDLSASVSADALIIIGK